MVKVKDVDLDKVIKLYKARIKHHEKHGCGNNVIKDKFQLKKAERMKQLRHDSSNVGGAHVFK